MNEITPAKILVVDDDPDIISLLKKLLLSEGYQVCSASHGQEALDVFRAEHPELVVLDVNMPIKDGFEVLNEIRQEDDRILVLMLTGQRSEEKKVQGLTGGADGYITKPFGAAEFLARIKSLFRRQTE